VTDVALEVPLAALGLGRLERDGAGMTRIEPRQEAADAALVEASRLEEDDEPLPWFDVGPVEEPSWSLLSSSL
jgi:hypothetical protein